MPGSDKTKRVRWLAVFSLGLLLVALGLVVARYLPLFLELQRRGVLGEPARRSYSGTTRENLRNLYVAMMAYHDSEERFPNASGWMDAIRPYTRTSDLETDAELDKFRDPKTSKSEDDYGYAMNDELSDQYIDDVDEPDRAILLFESTDRSWNAHGDPKTISLPSEKTDPTLAVTASGEIEPIESLL